mmetsp:Transcript_10240/g.30418  ORF Transcript_10240/g.30418 Transcript_10240/m.30418 type:complete len:1065 (+) Transcript_10240:2-3196(+)
MRASEPPPGRWGPGVWRRGGAAPRTRLGAELRKGEPDILGLADLRALSAALGVRLHLLLGLRGRLGDDVRLLLAGGDGRGRGVLLGHGRLRPRRQDDGLLVPGLARAHPVVRRHDLRRLDLGRSPLVHHDAELGQGGAPLLLGRDRLGLRLQQRRSLGQRDVGQVAGQGLLYGRQRGGVGSEDDRLAHQLLGAGRRVLGHLREREGDLGQGREARAGHADLQGAAPEAEPHLGRDALVHEGEELRPGEAAQPARVTVHGVRQESGAPPEPALGDRLHGEREHRRAVLAGQLRQQGEELRQARRQRHRLRGVVVVDLLLGLRLGGRLLLVRPRDPGLAALPPRGRRRLRLRRVHEAAGRQLLVVLDLAVPGALLERLHEHPAEGPLHLEHGVQQVLLEEDVAEAEHPAAERLHGDVARREGHGGECVGGAQDLLPVEAAAAVQAGAVGQRARGHGGAGPEVAPLARRLAVGALDLPQHAQQLQEQVPVALRGDAVAHAEEADCRDGRQLHGLRQGRQAHHGPEDGVQGAEQPRVLAQVGVRPPQQRGDDGQHPEAEAVALRVHPPLLLLELRELLLDLLGRLLHLLRLHEVLVGDGLLLRLGEGGLLLHELLHAPVEVLQLQAQARREVVVAGAAALQRLADVAHEEDHARVALDLERLRLRVLLPEAVALPQDQDAQVDGAPRCLAAEVVGRLQEGRAVEDGLGKLLDAPPQRLVAEVRADEHVEELAQDEVLGGRRGLVRGDLQRLEGAAQQQRHAEVLIAVLLGHLRRGVPGEEHRGGSVGDRHLGLLDGALDVAEPLPGDGGRLVPIPRRQGSGDGVAEGLVGGHVAALEEGERSAEVLAPRVHRQAGSGADRSRSVRQRGDQPAKGRRAELLGGRGLLRKAHEELRADERLHVVDAVELRGEGGPRRLQVADGGRPDSRVVVRGARDERELRLRVACQPGQPPDGALPDGGHLVERELEELRLGRRALGHHGGQGRHKGAPLRPHGRVLGGGVLAAGQQQDVLEQSLADAGRRAGGGGALLALGRRAVGVEVAGDVHEERAGPGRDRARRGVGDDRVRLL